MLMKELDVQSVRDLVGWAYFNMNWLSDDQAQKANRKRNELLKAVSGGVNSHFMGNKIGPGLLSPGCLCCGQGSWSCLFIGSRCTASCFYCPQNRKSQKDEPPNESGLIFDDPEDYVDYLEKFKFRGVGFSGGEPLLEYDKILTYTKKIRERLGKDIYIWLYTNGDLVDERKLKGLKQAGLNEIRFDIAAREYDLKAVKMATRHLDTVTVEIPAIPEDYEILKRCLPRMKKMGVAHLNLHQLHGSAHCYQNFVDRRYTFLHQLYAPVLESEITALRLLKHAVLHNIGLAINYCSTSYKNRFQKKAYRERLQVFIKEDCEELTESGFIRRLSVRSKKENIRKLVRMIEAHQCDRALWRLGPNPAELIIHSSVMPYIDFNQHSLNVSYFAPQLLADRLADDEGIQEIALNSHRSVFVERKHVHGLKLTNAATVKGLQEFYIERKNIHDVFTNFHQHYDLKTKTDLNTMLDERERLISLARWECIGSGLHELY